MFKVPEARRNLTHPKFGSTSADGNNGYFILPSPESGYTLQIIASDGLGWEHVSVLAYDRNGKSRIPNWKEMCFIKNEFWGDEDVVMQLFPKKSEYVNNHQSVLHLWRPTDREIPTPPSITVGIKE